MTQQPESQPTELALSHLNDDHPFNCDDNDNVFFISSSDDKRQLEVNARVIHGTRPSKIKDFILSDDEDDGFLSYYESDDNEYNICSDEETNEILWLMDVNVRENMYIPKHSKAMNFVVGM